MHRNQWRSAYFWISDPVESKTDMLIMPPTEAFLLVAMEAEADLKNVDGIEVSLTLQHTGQEYVRLALATIMQPSPYKLHTPLMMSANTSWAVRLHFKKPFPCEIQVHLAGEVAIQRPWLT